MEIKLPSLNGKDITINNKSSIVLIGANGSGKTRMSAWIEYHNTGINIHRVSAQKSLNMPKMTRPSEMSQVQEVFLYGGNNNNKNWLKSEGKKVYRWGSNPETHMLDDFSALMTLLVTEEYEKSLEYRDKHKNGDSTFDNITKLETIKKVWENVLPNKKLKIEAGKIEVYNINAANDLYNGAEMSDGERAIFYFIGEVICVLENSLVIIDEPENHLHKSILVRLWDAIESERPDCNFLYITHDLEFATSRTNSQLIWIRNMPKKEQWDYEIINLENDEMDKLRLEIMGNRQKVLLIEGKDTSSLDKKLYSRLFPDYNVISVDSCSKVIECTKAYNALSDLNYVVVKGIIDRDRRSDDEIKTLNKENVFCPEVAEIENLFLLPEIIEKVADQLMKSDKYEQILSDAKKHVFEFLQKEIDNQALLFTKQEINNDIYKLANQKSTTLEEYQKNISSIPTALKITETCDNIKQKIRSILDEQDYYAALKIINNKGLLNNSGIPSAFGWKQSDYIDYVFRLVNNSTDTQTILKKYICIE